MGLGGWAAQAAWRAIYSTSPTSRHPSAASNEERSGAPGPHGGHLAGRRLLGFFLPRATLHLSASPSLSWSSAAESQLLFFTFNTVKTHRGLIFCLVSHRLMLLENVIVIEFMILFYFLPKNPQWNPSVLP